MALFTLELLNLLNFENVIVCFSTIELAKDSNSSHFGRMGLNWQVSRSPEQVHK